MKTRFFTGIAQDHRKTAGKRDGHQSVACKGRQSQGLGANRHIMDIFNPDDARLFHGSIYNPVIVGKGGRVGFGNACSRPADIGFKKNNRFFCPSGQIQQSAPVIDAFQV